MTDIVEPEKRSQMMARIGPKNTVPELAVRRVAQKLGLRYRLHRKDLPGKPDLIFPGYRLALFVHGCFWHRHSGCANCTDPKTRPSFWQAKFAATVKRDQRAISELHDQGWRTLVIWECDTQDEALIHRLLSESIFLAAETSAA